VVAAHPHPPLERRSRLSRFQRTGCPPTRTPTRPFSYTSQGCGPRFLRGCGGAHRAPCPWVDAPGFPPEQKVRYPLCSLRNSRQPHNRIPPETITRIAATAPSSCLTPCQGCSGPPTSAMDGGVHNILPKPVDFDSSATAQDSPHLHGEVWRSPTQHPYIIRPLLRTRLPEPRKDTAFQGALPRWIIRGRRYVNHTVTLPGWPLFRQKTPLLHTHHIPQP